MKAVCWHGKNDVRVETVPEPTVINARDAILKVTLTAICGSDLHLYNGQIPSMKSGDILGHEFMGEVVEVGTEVKNLKKGDRVVVPFTIACGRCFFCTNQMFSLCDNSNPNAAAAEKLYGYSGSGLFGYSHLYGGYAGGQAQYVRVPFADVGPMVIPDSVSDERALFLTDIFPTAYMAAENCTIYPGDVIAVWGLGPVGQLTVRCAFMLGAERVIGIDDNPDRRALAQNASKAEVLDSNDGDLLEKLKAMTGGRGPDACIDAVGMEAHGSSIDALYDRAKHAVMLETDRPHALRQAIQACRKRHGLDPGVYGGFIDKFPIGAAFGKGLTLRMGQTHVHKYLKPLLARIEKNEIDPSFIITHRLSIDEGSRGYETFNAKTEGCIKVVLKP